MAVIDTGFADDGDLFSGGISGGWAYDNPDLKDFISDVVELACVEEFRKEKGSAPHLEERYARLRNSLLKNDKNDWMRDLVDTYREGISSFPEVWEEDKLSSVLEFEWMELDLGRVRDGLKAIFETSGTGIEVELQEDEMFPATVGYECWYVYDEKEALRNLRKYLGR
jgi:hypothetical protein